MRERVIEQHLVRRVKELGGEVRKVGWIGRSGAPDRLVLLPGGKTFWVELKATDQKPSRIQEREHTRMRVMGQDVVVIDSLQAIDSLLTVE